MKFSLLKYAIEHKKQIEFNYQGYFRQACPHLLGFKRGQARVLVFQFGGDSERGLLAGGDWRCMAVDDMMDLTLCEGSWHTRPTGGTPQTCITEVVTEVS